MYISSEEEEEEGEGGEEGGPKIKPEILLFFLQFSTQLVQISFYVNCSRNIILLFRHLSKYLKLNTDWGRDVIFPMALSQAATSQWNFPKWQLSEVQFSKRQHPESFLAAVLGPIAFSIRIARFPSPF